MPHATLRAIDSTMWAQVPPTVIVEMADGGFPWRDLFVAMFGGLVPAVVAFAVVVKGGRYQAAAQDRDFEQRETEWTRQRAADEKRWQEQRAADDLRWREQQAHERDQYFREERRRVYTELVGAVYGLMQEGVRTATLGGGDESNLSADVYISEQRRVLTALGAARLVASPKLRARTTGVYAAVVDVPHPRRDPTAWTASLDERKAARSVAISHALRAFEADAYVELTGAGDLGAADPATAAADRPGGGATG